MNIKRKNLVSMKTLQGQVIEPEKLTSTFNPLTHTDLVAYSIPTVLLIPFGREPIYGLITDSTVLDNIKEKWDGDSHFWSESIANSHANVSHIQAFAGRVTGQEANYLGRECANWSIIIVPLSSHQL